MTGERILLIEEDPHARDVLKYNLVMAGYEVAEAVDELAALQATREGRPDLFILGIPEPGSHGVNTCRAIREESVAPIIVLGVDAEEAAKRGELIEADECIRKPFAMRDLLHRISAALGRTDDGSVPEPPERQQIGNFLLSRLARTATINGAEVPLARREFDLLSFLVAHPNRVHSRRFLLQQVWGYDFIGDPKTVNVHVRWLRAKISEAPLRIASVRGAGYRLDSEA